jgi:hypothetical protein
MATNKEDQKKKKPFVDFDSLKKSKKSHEKLINEDKIVRKF